MQHLDPFDVIRAATNPRPDGPFSVARRFSPRNHRRTRRTGGISCLSFLLPFCHDRSRYVHVTVTDSYSNTANQHASRAAHHPARARDYLSANDEVSHRWESPCRKFEISRASLLRSIIVSVKLCGSSFFFFFLLSEMEFSLNSFSRSFCDFVRCTVERES